MQSAIGEPMERFQSSLEENPEWNMIMIAAKIMLMPFQSSLEENPEWNPSPFSRAVGYHRFNPHSRKTPSGTRRWKPFLSP